MNRDDPIRRATALAYDGQGAPRVVATGAGEVADRIIATAVEHGVPLDEDPALARLLAQVGLGEEIPPRLYAAVAQVLAFAWSVSGRLQQGGHRD